MLKISDPDTSVQLSLIHWCQCYSHLQRSVIVQCQTGIERVIYLITNNLLPYIYIFTTTVVLNSVLFKSYLHVVFKTYQRQFLTISVLNNLYTNEN